MALPVLYDVQIAAQQQGRVIIGWRPIFGAVIPAGTQLEIRRSYNERDGFVLLDTVPIGDGLYVDDTFDIQDQWTIPFYKLTVISTDDGSKEYGPYHFRDEPDKIGRAIIRRANLLMRNIGVPVLIYQEAFGSGTDRCPDCWDPISQQAIYSNCETCHGSTYATGSAEGFYQPILTLVDIRPPVRVEVVRDQSSQPSTASLRMSNFPLLRPRDIIREVNSGVLWRVASVVANEKDRVVLTQDPVELVQIKPGDVEKDLPVPTNIVPVMQRRLVRKEAVLVDNEGGTPQFLEVRV